MTSENRIEISYFIHLDTETVAKVGMQHEARYTTVQNISAKYDIKP